MIDEIIAQFRPISLNEMKGIRLMNRIDTKFVTTMPSLLQLLRMACHEYQVQEIGKKRIAAYHTLYFDTPLCEMYLHHHNGWLSRQKVRIRSYLDSGQSFLEVKTKNNHRRTKKKRMPIQDHNVLNVSPGMWFQDQDERFAEYSSFLRCHLAYDPESLVVEIENNFKRITLVNRAKTERVTIDTSVCFHNAVTGQRLGLGNLAIIELKRNRVQYSPILEMLRQLRIKPTGFSKYCMGCAMTNPSLKCNRFKEQIHAISKLAAQQ